MSLKIINGQVINTKANGAPVSAPTPSQIAERAYDVAIEQAVSALDSYPIDIQGVNLGALVREFMGERKAETLAALRQSVVSPSATPWWTKP